MSWNNLMPAWIVMEVCRNCGKKLKYSREEKPGTDCVECGGDLELADLELEEEDVKIAE